MNKYLAILDRKTLVLTIICIVITYLCDTYEFTYDLNITLFSIAIIFPLVFTMRESFKRRDSALKFLSKFKASILALHQAISGSKKLPDDFKTESVNLMGSLSETFLSALQARELETAQTEACVDKINGFIRDHREHFSWNTSIKLLKFVENMQESIENTFSLKLHGTPISLRAYCLVFIYMSPVIFTPTILYNLGGTHLLTAYFLSVIHGFVLISLYNVQDHMEDPFDQIGLDDIRLTEYRFDASSLAEQGQH